MKMLRAFLIFALVCGLAGAAKADQADFHMVVLDPFSTYPIFSAPFTFSFAPCSAGQLPTNVMGSYEGCFSGVNRTGSDWIGLELAFQNTSALDSQPANCSLDGSQDLFQSAECSLSGTEYFLDFSAGAVPNNGSFVIAEDGVNPSLFPTVTATVTTATATPEPGSMWLLGTGILALGYAGLARRRSALSQSRL
jgi:hypothetical protein